MTARRALLLAGVLVTAGCESLTGVDNEPPGGGGAIPGGVESARLDGMTDAHNAVRASVGEDLPDLAWSSDLAEVAQAYAEEIAGACELVHSGGQYGENLAYFGGRRATAEQTVNLWSEERECYTYGPFMKGDSCTGDCGACGHYTQIVWRDTRLVGCGVAACPGGNEEEVWVCNYDPPGNYVGQRPY